MDSEKSQNPRKTQTGDPDNMYTNSLKYTGRYSFWVDDSWFVHTGIYDPKVNRDIDQEYMSAHD